MSRCPCADSPVLESEPTEIYHAKNGKIKTKLSVRIGSGNMDTSVNCQRPQTNALVANVRTTKLQSDTMVPADGHESMIVENVLKWTWTLTLTWPVFV